MKTSFHNDARAWLAAELAKVSSDVPSSADTSRLACLFFNVIARTIPAARRTVHTSRVLAAKLADPQTEASIVDAVREIARRSEAGASLRPFQSTRLTEPGGRDLLLYDWGIHHLHVGPLHEPRSLRRARSRKEPRRGYFTGRRDELLFAFVDGANLYLIDVLDHHAFEDRSLIEIVHREWPEVLRPYLAPGAKPASRRVVPEEERMTPAQLRSMRSMFVLATTMDDGSVYVTPGGGTSMGGLSANAMAASCRFLTSVRTLEKNVHEREEFLRGVIERAGYVVGELDVKLEFDDASFVKLRERSSGVVIGTDLQVRASGHIASDDDVARSAA